ncbi:MAG TPA: hypothetical protein VN520_16385 [Streptomyces sp.]|uniref:hypothetical protein n=1 Tax=Streptomyces sp. TaxID=1931 RepID=UPI002C43EA6A|nr:hypothetical protein [Streptomyces sp.]HWU07935.1 hypothetical protein [Streptomyces sp.]
MPRKPANSKAGLLMGLGSSAVAVLRTVKQVRRTGGTRGRPTAAHTASGLLPLVPPALLVLRRLRGHSRQHSR